MFLTGNLTVSTLDVILAKIFVSNVGHNEAINFLMFFHCISNQIRFQNISIQTLKSIVIMKVNLKFRKLLTPLC